jgi:hypothetical protein
MTRHLLAEWFDAVAERNAPGQLNHLSGTRTVELLGGFLLDPLGIGGLLEK